MADDQLKDEIDAGESLASHFLNQVSSDAGEEPIPDNLEEWLRENPETQEAFDELMDPSQRRLLLQSVRRIEEKMPVDLARLEAAQDALNTNVNANSQRAIRKLAYYLSGAAAVVLIAAGTLLLFKHSPKTVQPGPMLTAQDIQPGGNKAILTLADGSTIALDSVGNGLLARQGKVHVVKSAQGQVDYQSGKSSDNTAAYNTMTTPLGGTFKLTLSDGTKVWLNAASSLRYPVAFAGMSRREVFLTGEAYFEVAGDKSAPFAVHAGSAAVNVLGTHFDIMAYQDEQELQTTLMEGKVAVNQGNATRIIEPGQQVRINPDGALSVVEVDPSDYAAWKDGLIQVHDADVPAMMRQIGRWYDVQIAYEGTHYPNWTLAGAVSRTLTLSQALKVLELSGIHCKLEGRKLTVILK